PVRSTRFEWKEQVDLGGSGGFVEHHMNTASSNTSAMMMNYEMLGIDLEKFKGEDDEMLLIQPHASNKYTDTQKRLPFNK
ncbi:MAG: hypothetical protein WCO63_15750, partial [Bacteroidota bacterium]